MQLLLIAVLLCGWLASIFLPYVCNAMQSNAMQCNAMQILAHALQTVGLDRENKRTPFCLDPFLTL